MKADTLTLKALFQKDVRYVIPTFQRPYVWNQDDQWEPLWDDVRNAAERYIDELITADGNTPLAEERTGSHFMGAVVFQQRPTPTADLETRDVIDGQQRLTTMQLLMDAAQEVFEEIGADPEAKRLARVVLNRDAEGDHVFKLWPTSLDRDAFRAAMTNGVDPSEFASSPIVQAHEFFRLQTREWIDAAIDPVERAHRIHGLETALLGLLELVVIDLGTADDAYVIFETLNARGTPLVQSDLVKNYILQTAAASGHSPEQVHDKYWRQFEDDWWRAETRQGRITRPRLDVFLNYWLVTETAAEVQSHEIFRTFKNRVEQNSKTITEVAAELQRVGATYRSLEEFPPFSPEGTFIYRWRVVDAGTVTPVLLWLFSAPETVLDRASRLRCLAALESFLVRRMLCRLTTKAYNKLFLDLLGHLREAEPGDAERRLVAFLSEQSAESHRWPDDTEVRNTLLDLPIYRLLTRGRVRMVLETIEDSLRSELSEESHVARGSLTIEHILPQSWHEHWPLPPDAGLEAELDRERLLHSLGNLTLVNGKLNPTLSNDAWSSKQKLLGAHTVLHINKQLLSTSGATWQEQEIRERGGALADRVTALWPGPTKA